MKQANLVAILSAAALAASASLALAADDKVPTTNGFSGNILFGAGYLDLESNLISGNKLIDVENKTITSVDASPKSEDDAYPFFTGEVDYTFGDQWQAYFGTGIEDLVTLDLAQRLGLRKEWDGVGVVGIALLLSGIPAEVYEDPYLVGTPRSTTDRNSTGARLDWWRMFGSGFFLQAKTRKIEIDDEQSGTDPALGLTAAQISSLRRDGDDSLFTIGYRWENGKSTWQPEVSFGNQDRDGDAVSNDIASAKLTYSYRGDLWTLVMSGLFSQQDYDEANPVYGEKADESAYAVAFTTFRKLSMGDGGWSAFGGASYGDSDSDVDFFDATGLGVNAGLQFRFGEK